MKWLFGSVNYLDWVKVNIIFSKLRDFKNQIMNLPHNKSLKQNGDGSMIIIKKNKNRLLSLKGQNCKVKI